jgi:tetratricopeptide (TPR) repeat protein
MKRPIFFIGFMIFFSLLALSQDYAGKGRIQGTVTDEEGNLLEGVTVKLRWVKTGSGFDVLTNSKGVWKASWIRGGTWHIDFEKSGYDSKNISVEINQLLKNPPIELMLKKAEGLVLKDDLKEDFKKGNMLYEEGKYKEAIESFKLIIENHPDAYIINMNIGNSYFQTKDYNQAEEYFIKVLEKEPENPNIIIAIGNCYSNRGDTAKALEWYKKIDVEKIDDPVVLYNIGTHFYNTSQYNEALKYYQKSVDIQKDFLDGIYQLSLSYLAMQNNAKALIEFENYLKYDPDSERSSQVVAFIEYLKKKGIDFVPMLPDSISLR